MEKEDQLRNFIRSHTPQVSHWSDFLKLNVQDVWKQITKGGYTSVLLAGGPPCQPWSALGSQKQWSDDRSDPLSYFFVFRDELKALCDTAHVQLHWMVEEVGSITKEAYHWISELAGVPAFLLHAGDFGWIHRARFFWCSAPADSFSALPNVEVLPTDSVLPDCNVVRWTGPSIPSKWKPESGSWIHRGECGLRGPVTCLGPWAPTFSTGRFLTLTTCFDHPADRGDASDPDLMARFSADGKRFPLAHYARGNLVGHSSSCLSPLSAVDRELLMGFPADFTSALDGSHSQVTGEKRGWNPRLSALGNAWHVPCAMMVIMACLRTGQSLTPPDPDDCFSAPVTNTVWATEWESTTTMSSSAWLNQSLALLPGVSFPPELIASAILKLPSQSFLRRFDEWHLQKHGHMQPGPDVALLVSKHTGIHTDSQRSSHGEGRPSALLPLDLSEDAHIAAAKLLRHPFADFAKLEHDLHFSVEANARLGPSSAATREPIIEDLRKLQRAVQHLDAFALSLRPVGHVPGIRPVLTAMLIVGLHWPDTELPSSLVHGFQLIGRLAPTGIFRPVSTSSTTDAELRNGFFSTAAEYVDSLEADNRIHPLSAFIVEETQKEIDLGLTSPLVNRAYLDNKYGHGCWRPLPRHIVQQEQKNRPIDDGRSASHNLFTEAAETIVCSRPEALAMAAKAFAEMTLSFHSTGPQPASLPSWFKLQAGTEDLWKGYRQNHSRAQDQGVAIATFVHPETGERVYTEILGLPFGLSSAVLQFNRFTALLTAVKRRVMFLLASHYFDDSTQLGLASLAAHVKRQTLRLMSTLQVMVGHPKRQRMSCMARFLGTLTDFSTVTTDMALVIGPWPTARSKASSLVLQHLEAGRLTSGEASKLRGTLQWMDLRMSGRPCRAALSELSRRQTEDSTSSIGESLTSALIFLKFAAHSLPDHCVRLRSNPQPPVIVYTDASTEHGPFGLRIGTLIIPRSGPCLVDVWDVPPEVQACLQERSSQIMPAELLAAPLTFLAAPSSFREQDVLFFIDNQAAMAALIRASSRASDCSLISLFCSVLVVSLRARAWYEYVNTKQNPADRLSRLGFEDPIVSARIQSGEWKPLRYEPQWQSVTGSLENFLSYILALGVSDPDGGQS